MPRLSLAGFSDLPESSPESSPAESPNLGTEEKEKKEQKETFQVLVHGEMMRLVQALPAQMIEPLGGNGRIVMPVADPDEQKLNWTKFANEIYINFFLDL
ncbi:hypothetical protein B7494_g8373 [Chlorociboria aeruginascens]|nr:hypothetical protein B7494_g8373 [Chlorociboria aeruginascens]